MVYNITTKIKSYVFECSTEPWVSASISEQQWLDFINSIKHIKVTKRI